MEKSIQQKIKEDLAAIYIGNLNTVEADLLLPLSGEQGTTFTWNTGESRFIAADGKVHRPLHGMGNRKVRLTVTGSLDGEEAERVFEATVLQEPRENIVKEIRPVLICGEPGTIPSLPSVVVVTCEDGRVMTMPVQWEEIPPVPASGEIRVKGALVENTTGSGPAAFAGKDRLETGGLYPEAVIRPAEEALPQGPAVSCVYRPMKEVRLTPGSVYYETQERMNAYLLAQNDDQMLYNFRKACGLSVKGAPPMTGWDEDSCKLKGHTTGHYLSGLALAYAATGDFRFRRKIDYMISSLAECQEAFARSGKVHEGFLSAYDEEQFDLLEVYTRYPEIWAPYYTLDKIMSGLYDCYTLAGNEQAFAIETKMGDWVYARLSRLPQEQLNRMWSMYIAGEFGGMLGTMVKLYQLTGKKEHLKAAELFYNEKLFYPMEQGVDTLEDMHANQHIPQIMGAVDMYAATGDARYWRIGSHFHEFVVEHHAYCVGGVGETEMFHAPYSTCRFLSDKAAESCASYNLLRLTGQLFPYQMDGRLMDYYENTLLNHIMTSASHTTDGGTTYFLPLGPGGRKEYSTEENTCCHGTGMESRYRFMENIYAGKGDDLYINLLVPSELSGEDSLSLEENEEGTVTITLKSTLAGKLHIHVPAWAQDSFAACINGKCVWSGGKADPEGKGAEEAALKDGFLELPAGMTEGTVITMQLPMSLRVMTNTSDASLINVACGPYILAGLSEETEFLPAPELTDIQRETGDVFRAGSMKMIPLARVDQEAYHVYFRR